MSTRCRIGIENKDGTIESIYSHWDGYPSGAGATLKEHYTNEDKIRQLLELGDLSILGSEIGQKQKFDKYPREHDNWCLSYGRDRNETNIKSKLHKDRNDFLFYTDKNWGEYAYLFSNGLWLYYNINSHTTTGWTELTNEIIKEV